MAQSSHDRLKEARKRLGKTQKEIAEVIGVKVSYYSDIENERRPVTKKFVEKLTSSFNISAAWILSGKGELFQTGTIQNVPQNVPFSVSSGEWNVWPYTVYSSLSDKQLDLQLSIEIEILRDTFEDLKKFTQAINSIGPPDFIIEKFPVFGTSGAFPTDFKRYRKELEDEFSETHAHVKDERRIKVLKIIDLYQSNIEHLRTGISRLIESFSRYSDFFFDKKAL